MIPRLSAEGERDLAEIYAWIYSDAPAAAERFLERLQMGTKTHLAHLFYWRGRGGEGKKHNTID